MIESLVGSEEANLFWSAYYDRYIAEEDVAKIAEEGFNSVRVPINARFLTGEGRGGRAEAHVDVAAGPNETKGKTSTQVEATSSTDRASHNIYPLGEDSISNRDAPDHESETRAPLELREDRLVLLDRVIGWCREHRLYVILDLHGAPGGQTGTNIDDSERDRPELFTDEIRAREAVAIWRALAERYKDEWIVAGYDLLNEPLPDWFSNYNDRVMPLYKEMIAAIREADERHMIILEGVHWSTDWSIFEHAFGDDPVDRNVLLQFHKYWNNPDTESIAKYLEFRDRWNVPIFMGEGGENNKDWYAGAFRMFDDHDISWNFWTWKKMDTTNSPCSIRKPEEWPLLVDYLQGGEKPEPTVARTILWEYLDNMALERCDYQPEVVRALMRRAPVRIPAVFYGYKGEGTSFGFGSAERPTFVNRAAAESASTAQAGVQFRVSDRTRISFAQSDRETASFAHGGGEEWTPDLWLCVEMTVGDWFVYDFERSSEGERTGEDPKLDVALRLQSIDGSGKLRLALNDGSAVILDVQERDWHTGQTVCRVAHSEGTQSLRLTCLEGKIRVMWVNIGES
ncbi:cellulase family glycosylhydrolase [Paenibacillus sp. PAMC21692]|nr:cellulase family glycosylhydrolase [Paenibacillus sp. PAMC21692]